MCVSIMRDKAISFLLAAAIILKIPRRSFFALICLHSFRFIDSSTSQSSKFSFFCCCCLAPLARRRLVYFLCDNDFLLFSVLSFFSPCKAENFSWEDFMTLFWWPSTIGKETSKKGKKNVNSTSLFSTIFGSAELTVFCLRRAVTMTFLQALQSGAFH